MFYNRLIYAIYRRFEACVRSTLLHGNKTWAPTASELQRLRRNNISTIQLICGVKSKDKISTDLLCARLGIQEVAAALRSKRFRWYGHVVRSISCINAIEIWRFHVQEFVGDQEGHSQIVLRLT